MHTTAGTRSRTLLGLVVVALALLLTACLTGEQQQVVDPVNRERATQGLKALAVNDQLVTKAQGWAEQMARNGKISHSTLTTGAPGCWQALGENVAQAGSIAGLHAAWMGSSPHRAQILSTTYTHIGVGVVHQGSSYYGVQVFMKAC